MTAADLVRLELFFDNYTRRFCGPDGLLPVMQELKIVHSRHVAADAARIIQAEDWPEAPRLLGLACALLHDIGRFSQYAEFQTFDDHTSINHAVRGCRTLREEHALDFLATEEQATILTAVGLHNIRELPAALTAAAAPFVHLVRDADKLDIFRVFETALRDGELDRHPEIMWSMDRHGRTNPALVEAVTAGRTVSYELVHTLCDLMLIQVGWLRGQLHFDSALALASARHALEFREDFVRTLDDTPAVRRCFDVTRAAMHARLAGAARAMRPTGT